MRPATGNGHASVSRVDAERTRGAWGVGRNRDDSTSAFGCVVAVPVGPAYVLSSLSDRGGSRLPLLRPFRQAKRVDGGGYESGEGDLCRSIGNSELLRGFVRGRLSG